MSYNENVTKIAKEAMLWKDVDKGLGNMSNDKLFEIKRTHPLVDGNQEHILIRTDKLQIDTVILNFKGKPDAKQQVEKLNAINFERKTDNDAANKICYDSLYLTNGSTQFQCHPFHTDLNDIYTFIQKFSKSEDINLKKIDVFYDSQLFVKDLTILFETQGTFQCIWNGKTQQCDVVLNKYKYVKGK